MLLDEPTASLDEKNARRCEDLLRSWLQDGAQGPRACLWITHQKDQAKRVGSRYLLVDDRKVREVEGVPA